MNTLDMYLKDKFNDYEFRKYERTHCIVKFRYNDRFDLLFEGDVSNVVNGDSKLKFQGIFDQVNNKLYLGSMYYNELVTQSEFEKLAISDVICDMEHDLQSAYHNYIMAHKEEYKKLAKPKFDIYYADEHNKEYLESSVLDAFKRGEEKKEPKFDICISFITDDILAYLGNPKEYIDNRIVSHIKEMKSYVYHSNYSGGTSVDVTAEEGYGMFFLRLEAEEKLMEEIKQGNHKDFKKLDKINKIATLCKDLNAQNIIVTFSYKGNELETQYPVGQLSRLYIADWYMPVAKRVAFKNLFKDEDWTFRDEDKIMTIKTIKYRGKVIYEDESI